MNKIKGFKILFLDESEILKSKNNWNYFMISGLIIDYTGIINLEKFLIEILKKESFNSLKDLRNKKELTKEKRLGITKQICDFLKHISSKIIVAILGDYSLKEFRKTKNNQNIMKYFECLCFILERFFLELKNSNSYGLIIFDSFSRKYEINLQEKVYKFILENEFSWYGMKSEGKYINYIYPTIIFTSDKNCKILEISDLISGAINEALKNSNIENLDIESLNQKGNYLKYYWDLFRKSPEGKVNGWGIKIWF